MPEKLYFHSSIRGLLAALARLDPQLGPVELVCMWFYDLYVPGMEMPQGYSQEVWDRGTVQWKTCFSEKELAALATFHETFVAQEADLRCAHPRWEDDPDYWAHWRETTQWMRIRDAAQIALTQITDRED